MRKTMCLAIPMPVKTLLGENQAIAGTEAFEMEISTVLVPDVREGEHVLVHAGFAIEVLDPEEATDMDRRLRELLAPE
jgi:hydrogenase expression/formation protein HypC